MTVIAATTVMPSLRRTRAPGAGDSLTLAPGLIRQEDPYRDGVREGDEVDRAAWAKLLAELLAAAGLTPEQAGSPGGPVRTGWRTIRRWLAQDHGVTAVKVRDVARDLGYPPLEALVRVGFLTREEARLSREPVAPAPPLPQPLRTIADVLTDRRVPDNVKEQLRAAVSAAFDLWANMYKLRAPRERQARDRSTTSK